MESRNAAGDRNAQDPVHFASERHRSTSVPERSQLIETAEDDDYVRMVQWEAEWDEAG